VSIAPAGRCALGRASRLGRGDGRHGSRSGRRWWSGCAGAWKMSGSAQADRGPARALPGVEGRGHDV